MPPTPLSAFISSTCYDLADLRAELAEHLTRDGFIVKRSEDPGSAFFVDPTDDSIESCLRNVEASDVVICIIDRRYGGILKHGPNAGLSATHVEVRHARTHKKPVFFFVREPAARDFDALRVDPNAPTRWTEPDDPAVRAKWLAFMKEIAALPRHTGWSNWCDPFKVSCDLKPLVRKRLGDYFPTQLGTLAIHPDRVLRLSFVRGGTAPTQIRGAFNNIGLGPAYNLRHGSYLDSKEFGIALRGGLGEGKQLSDPGQVDCLYPAEPPGGAQLDPNAPRCVFCEYENRFGDAYRVEVPLHKPNPTGNWQAGSERFFVRLSDGTWLKVSG